MNIFIFSKNLQASAAFFFKYDFKRANKQILESAQMIAVACDHFGIEIPLAKSGNPYKLTHKNHPCTIWTRKSKENFWWHVYYLYMLCYQYSLQTGKIHQCYKSCTHLFNQSFILNHSKVQPEFIGSEEYMCQFWDVNKVDGVYSKYIRYLANKHYLEKSTGEITEMYFDWFNIQKD